MRLWLTSRGRAVAPRPVPTVQAVNRELLRGLSAARVRAFRPLRFRLISNLEEEA